MKVTRLVLIATVLFVAFSASLYSQDLLRTNPNYIEARELQVQANQAYQAGEYDKSVEYADESKRLSDLAEVEARDRLLQLQANGWKKQAERRLQYAEGIAADKRYPEEYRRAKELFDTAQSAYDAGDYQRAIDRAKAVLAILEDIVPK